MDMTDGSIFSLLLKFAIPMLIGNLFQQVYNLVDSIIVGKMIGEDALAAVGATNSITFLFFALCNGIGSGGGIVVSQMYGAKEEKNLKKCIINTAYVMIIMPILVGGVACLVARPLLTFMKTPENIFADSLSYMYVMCAGIIFVSMYNFISSMLRALGDSVTPLIFLIASCILNTGLDVLFVKIGMGVFGAALATIISQFLAGLGSILYAMMKNEYFKFDKSDFGLNSVMIKRIIKLGIPLSLQFSMIAISCMALQRVINHFGTVAMAAFTATSRIENVIHQPYQTLGASLSTFTGQNYGSKKNDRVVSGYRIGLIMMACFSIFMLPIMQFFGNAIMKIFVDEPAVIEMGAKGIKVTSLFYIFLGTIYVIRGVLNGLGDGFFALLNGIVEVIGRFVVPVWVTGYAFIGVWGIWWSSGLVWFLSGFTAWLRYIYYKKKKLHFNDCKEGV